MNNFRDFFLRSNKKKGEFMQKKTKLKKKIKTYYYRKKASDVNFESFPLDFLEIFLDDNCVIISYSRRLSDREMNKYNLNFIKNIENWKVGDTQVEK